MLRSKRVADRASIVPRYTPLRLAAWKGTATAVKALLDAGADFKIKDYMGYNILSKGTPGCRK